MFCFKTCVQSDLDAEVDNIINIDLLCVGLLLKFKIARANLSQRLSTSFIFCTQKPDMNHM